jgi:hypothetical protein
VRVFSTLTGKNIWEKVRGTRVRLVIYYYILQSLSPILLSYKYKADGSIWSDTIRPN